MNNTCPPIVLTDWTDEIKHHFDTEDEAREYLIYKLIIKYKAKIEKDNLFILSKRLGYEYKRHIEDVV